MSRVQETHVVNASIAPTWAAVSKMGAVQDWHPNVARAVVLTTHDTGVGASRRVEFQDGNSVVETVIEESERQFTTMEMTEMPMMKKANCSPKIRTRSELRAAHFFFRRCFFPPPWVVAGVYQIGEV